ncbi:MAG TPA: hypothetical protein P5555_01655 [Candidatus Paceibacterota bacterium]|nr:hypothetical protein [Verrucomicrobiota bacterium]HOX01017.1 hypothetical protein [Verrucomicrobiota bacterium]HRZ43879.1 hypothetical protein [Candidatus Paceibacterota bacterium]HRZ93180.1 hypothetical protein [Candidatus Paceibacterota bacterium]
METRKSFLLRMDPDLWRALEAWAQEDLRSVNGQIEYLLREAVIRHRTPRRITPDADPATPSSIPDPGRL